jgi:hypothetical protein|tara:strand:- start:4 stop:276 length:273 start_codon:yes stop_codon:yes gene_type:complete
MDNKEKYYNYIIDDLLKDVVVDEPYEVIVHGIELDYRAFGRNNGLTIDHRFVNDLKPYLFSRYGIRESELNIIWFRFSKKVFDTLIEKGK